MLTQVLKDIQTILKQAGFYNGVVDGVFGFISYSALQNLSISKSSKTKIAAKDIQKILVEQRVYFGAIDGAFGQNSFTAFNALLPLPVLTDDKLKAIYKNAKAGFAEHINSNAVKFGIKNKADLCAFLANVIHESGGFTKLRESMNYSPQRLIAVFPKYFKKIEVARSIAGQGQIAIADVVYGGRLGNGKDNGDGFKYRGGGLIHLTFKNNYEIAGIGIGLGRGLVTNPERITEPEIAVKTAMWYWQKNFCTRYANQNKFLATCQAVNLGASKVGSTTTPNGQDDREAIHKKAWSVLN